MPAGYKPERPVTSEKIKAELDKLGVAGRDYARKFKKRLPLSRGWIRGFVDKWPAMNGKAKDAIALSDPDDKKLLEVYLVDDCYLHAKSLGIEEVLTSE